MDSVRILYGFCMDFVCMGSVWILYGVCMHLLTWMYVHLGTVAILAQGTSWAVAVTQAYFYIAFCGATLGIPSPTSYEATTTHVGYTLPFVSGNTHSPIALSGIPCNSTRQYVLGSTR